METSMIWLLDRALFEMVLLVGVEDPTFQRECCVSVA